MAEFRTIQSKLWDDGWFCSKDCEGKLFWIYLLTNSRASVSGIYILRAAVAAAECGLDISKVEYRFMEFATDGKIDREGDILWVRKLRDYQATSSPTVIARIAKDLASIPECALNERYLLHYANGLNTTTIPYRQGIQQHSHDTDTDTGIGTEKEKGDTSSSLLCSHHIARAYIDTFIPGGVIPHGKEAQGAIEAIHKLEVHPKYSEALSTYKLAKRAMERWKATRQNGSRKPLQYISAALIDELNAAQEVS